MWYNQHFNKKKYDMYCVMSIDSTCLNGKAETHPVRSGKIFHFAKLNNLIKFSFETNKEDLSCHTKI